MKKKSIFITLLISALMIFGIFAAVSFAGDDAGETGESVQAAEEESVIGLRSSTHRINITNASGKIILVNGLKDSGGFVWEQGAGTKESYTTPDVITSIETKCFISFTGTVPNYEVYPSPDDGYKYYFEFTDEDAYNGDLNLTVKEDENSILLTFDANDDSGNAYYMTSTKKKAVDLSDIAFERDGYELAGWALEPDAESASYTCDYVAHPSKDYTFYAVWQHVHDWSLTKTGSNTASLECLNEGCGYNPITLTLSAEDSTYSGDKYDSENLVTVDTGDETLPEDVIETGDLVFKNALGRTIDTPTDAGNYTASVTYSLNDGSEDSITLKDGFTIKKRANLKYMNIIEGWTEGETPNAPDTSWTKSNKPLVLYVDADSAIKIATIASSLMNKESISISDFKGVKARLLPPSEAGEYMIVVLGVTKNYVDIGLDAFVIDEKTGVMEVGISDWTYGEYDEAVNGPVVTIDDVDVTESSEIDYRPLFSSYDEYTTFDPDEADHIDAGVYMMRVRVADNSTDETHKMIKLFTVKKAYCYTNEPMAIDGLVADGTEHKLVTEGSCESDNCWFMYSMTTSLKRPISYSEEIPSASEAGTYYVWYIFCSENNNYYSYVSVFPLKVTIADPMDDPEEPSEEPEEEVSVPAVEGFAVKPASKAVKVKWDKPDDTSSISFAEIQYSTDKSFSEAKTVKVSKNKASYKIRKLKKTTKYYVRMKFVRTDGDERYESEWTAVKKVKTKK